MPASERPRHVAVIGGGFAGLSCAVELVRAGVRVTLLEARRSLGGRAASFTDEASGDVVDNGQHLFLSSYAATRSFLAAIGTDLLLRFQPRLSVDYLEPGRRTRLRAAPLPSPWHLLAGVMTLKGLSHRDRAAILRAGPALRRLSRNGAQDLESVTVSAWLDRLGQTPELKRRLWHPLAVAALNESPDRAPASLLACVLRDGFLAGARGSCLGAATVGLSDLYAEPARRWLQDHGAVVLTSAPVTGLTVEGDRVRAIVLRDGLEVSADAFVSAVPPGALQKLGVPMSDLSRFASSPIVSINLWLDRTLGSIQDLDFAAVLGGRVQWLFNKARLLGEGAGHLAAVISAAAEEVDRSADDLAGEAWQEIQACLPEARGAKLTRHLVVRERAATFAATVEAEPLRPGPRSPYENLLLAGDWTVRGMPATIEAAVRSGQACARIMTRGE